MTTANSAPASLGYVWSLNGPALSLYVLAVVILLAVLAVNLNLADALAAAFKERTAALLAAAGGLALVSNLVGTATISLLAKSLHEPARLSMAVVPLILVAERYLRLYFRETQKRPARLAGLLGSAAGIAGGTWLLLRGPVQSEAVARAPVAANVKTAPLDQVLNGPESWTISVQLIFLYVAALAIFFAAHAGLKRVAAVLAERQRERPGRQALLVLLAALVLNGAGVAVLRPLAAALGSEPRLAMVGVAFFLILESYVQLLRGTPENRGPLWAGLVGTAGGMGAATFLLMRDAPLH